MYHFLENKFTHYLIYSIEKIIPQVINFQLLKWRTLYVCSFFVDLRAILHFFKWTPLGVKRVQILTIYPTNLVAPWAIWLMCFPKFLLLTRKFKKSQGNRVSNRESIRHDVSYACQGTLIWFLLLVFVDRFQFIFLLLY